MRNLFLLACATVLTLGLAVSGFAGSIVDNDADGIPNSLDNCITTPNGPLLGLCSANQDANENGYGNACEADWDLDGIVGGSDFLIFSASFGATPGDPNWAPQVDSDCDNIIGGSDFLLFSGQFGGVAGPSGLSCAATLATGCGS